ncbi:hypothetical protein BGX31_004145 [Mortierella sp. GBA43]|nr:hypothetical protein BGX31_004145 [Mortierella sp. GBA43]
MEGEGSNDCIHSVDGTIGTIEINRTMPRIETSTLESWKYSVLADTWPMLEDLCLDESRASDEQLSQIIKNMRRVTGFSVAKTSFNILSMSVLQYHFHCLRRVNTSYLIQMDDITSSELTIEILKSCPKLERLKARGLPAEYLMNNTPWACEITLRTLEVSLEIKPSPGGDAPQQEAIMTRLSKLVNLERLDMSNKWIWKPIQLSCGLKRLGTLTKLQELVLPIERQCLSLEDVEWMIAHWRNLKSIEGDVSWDDDDPESLIAKFSEAGIGAHKLSVSEM